MTINGNTTLAEIKAHCTDTKCNACNFLDAVGTAACCMFGNLLPRDWQIPDPPDTQPDQSAKQDANKPRPTLIHTGILKAVSAIRRVELDWKTDRKKPMIDGLDCHRVREDFQDKFMEYLDNPEAICEDIKSPVLHRLARYVELLIEWQDDLYIDPLLYGTIPFPSLVRGLAAVREYGLTKYADPDNWRKVEPARYRDAMWRHWLAYLDDPDSKDEESCLSHLWHVACNIMFLIALEAQNEDYNRNS